MYYSGENNKEKRLRKKFKCPNDRGLRLHFPFFFKFVQKKTQLIDVLVEFYSWSVHLGHRKDVDTVMCILLD